MLVSTHIYLVSDVDVGCSLHVANPPSRSRMQPWCTCEATVSLFARALVAVDRRMFRISYDSHQHHRMLSFACIMHAPPSVSSLASRRDFASRSARILWPSVFLAAIFRTYGRVLPKCRFSRSVLGGLLPYPAPLCTFSVSALLMYAAFLAGRGAVPSMFLFLFYF